MQKMLPVNLFPRSGRTAGFSLMELMVVIALMAMLLSFSLPAYQRYLQRTQIAEGFSLIAPLQMAMNEFVYEAGRAPAALSELGFAEPPQGRYIQQAGIQRGTIVVTYGNAAHAKLQGKTLRLIPYLNPDQSLVWRCHTGSLPPRTTLLTGSEDTPLTSDLLSDLLPASCR